MPEASLAAAAGRLFAALETAGLRLVLAESCTGGLACGAFTDIPGSSRYLWGGFVTYSPEAKIGVLGVDAGTIEGFGVVSRETALAMARGALEASGLGEGGLAAAVTGFAGPGTEPGEGQPGRVCCAWVGPEGRSRSIETHFSGGRREIREKAATALLEGAWAMVEAGAKSPGTRY